MTRLEEFIEYLKEQVKNHSIYIWGGQGQSWPTVTEEWIKKKESGNDQTKALKLYREAVAAGYKEKLRAFDCSGLGMYFIQNLKHLSKTDLNSNGMKGKCTLIEKKDLKMGDWVFRTYKSGSKKGRAYHVGYVVDEDLNVIEARGRAYGVQMRPLNASGSGYWNTFGRPSYFEKDNLLLQGPEVDGGEIDMSKMPFGRNLQKGNKGQDVKNLQTLLNKIDGDDLKVDGDFGSKTQASVEHFQAKKGLEVDGIAGIDTVTALGGTWSYSFNRNLRKGDKGQDVKELQKLLNVVGYDLSEDGKFGSATDKAVREYQKDKGLEVDGLAGKNTIKALGAKWVG